MTHTCMTHSLWVIGDAMIHADRDLTIFCSEILGFFVTSLWRHMTLNLKNPRSSERFWVALPAGRKKKLITWPQWPQCRLSGPLLLRFQTQKNRLYHNILIWLRHVSWANRLRWIHEQVSFFISNGPEFLRTKYFFRHYISFKLKFTWIKWGILKMVLLKKP